MTQASQRRNLAALRAYIDGGSIKGAAHILGLTDSSVRRRLADYCEEHEMTLPAAVFDLGRQAERAHFTTSERGPRVA